MMNWLLNLEPERCFGLVFFGSMLICVAVVFIIGEVRQHLFDKRAKALSDQEFEWADDPYALLLCEPRVIAGAPQLSTSHSTCVWCEDRSTCAGSFEAENIEGYCSKSTGHGI